MPARVPPLAAALAALAASAAAFLPQLTAAHKADGSLLTLQGSRDCVYSVAFDADGSHVAAACKDGSIYLWDAHGGQEPVICKGGAVLRLAYSPDGKTLASGGQNKTVRLWDAATGKQLQKLQGARITLPACFSARTASASQRRARIDPSGNGKLRRPPQAGDSSGATAGSAP